MPRVTPGYFSAYPYPHLLSTRTRTCSVPVPAQRVRVLSWVHELIPLGYPVPVPVMGNPRVLLILLYSMYYLIKNKLNRLGSLMLPASATLSGWVHGAASPPARVCAREVVEMAVVGTVVVVEVVEPRHLRLAFARGRW